METTSQLLLWNGSCNCTHWAAHYLKYGLEGFGKEMVQQHLSLLCFFCASSPMVVFNYAYVCLNACCRQIVVTFVNVRLR